MKFDKELESQRWFKQAEADLDDAFFLFKGKRYNVATFFCQQSAEKSLKAYLYYEGVDNPWGHSVADLCLLAARFDNSFKKIEKDGSLLDKYYIPTRYPNGLPGGIPKNAFDKGDGEKAIKVAKKIITFVKNKIS